MLTATACGSDSATSTTDSESNAAPATGAPSTDNSESVGEIATVVVTTNILGDVVSELLDGQAEVITIMPVGAGSARFSGFGTRNQPDAQCGCFDCQRGEL